MPSNINARFIKTVLIIYAAKVIKGIQNLSVKFAYQRDKLNIKLIEYDRLKWTKINIRVSVVPRMRDNTVSHFTMQITYTDL